ncbi:MAG: hypothetical protein A2049_04460 [Elusimicrobia bacterium GWA2_62_23]|nr:MAG: hypothetical protein A2049_04460 [Elusimicrobia bacterium GWA2_62_23]
MTHRENHSSLRLAASAAAAFIFVFSGSALADISSGGEYAIESSVLDAGGGEKLNGGEYSAKGSLAQVSLPENAGLSVGGEYVNREGFYNPPHMTFQKGLAAVMSMPSGEMTIALPPGAVDKERFDITMNRDPLASPLAVDPDKINEANSKIIYNEGPWSQLSPGSLTEMSIFDEQTFYTKPLAEKGVLTMRYPDVNNDGILDGSNPPVRVDTLNAWTLDQNRNMWMRLPDFGADTSARTLSVYFGLPGVYAVIGAIDDSVRDVFAFPVPFRPNGPQAGTGQGQTGTEAAGITFSNVPQSGRIEIYTLDGRLVRKLAIPDNLILPEVKWNVRTAGGERAASGVYIWRVVSGGNAKTGKLMVIW